MTGRHTIALRAGVAGTALMAHPRLKISASEAPLLTFCSSRRECRFSLRRRFEAHVSLSMSLLFRVVELARYLLVRVCALCSVRLLSTPQRSYTPLGLSDFTKAQARVSDPLRPRSPPVRARPARTASNRIESQFLVKICQTQVPPLIKNSAK